MAYTIPFRRLLVAAAIILSLLASGCSSKVAVPPVTYAAAGLEFTGKFIWFDLITSDPVVASRFYDQVFGWSFLRTDPDNGGVKTIFMKDRPHANMFQRLGETSTGWRCFMSVPDATRAYESALSMGATSVQKPAPMPHRGDVTVITDPVGARLALLHSPTGDPRDELPAQGRFLGAQLWIGDNADAIDFYTRLAGYELHDEGMKPPVVAQLIAGGRVRADVCSLPTQSLGVQWVPSIGVLDIAETMSRVHAAGGRVLVKPENGTGPGSVALVADPLGSVIGIEQFEPPED